MATKKQLEAKIKKLESRIKGNTFESKDIVSTAETWISKKLGVKVVSKTPNKYKVADGTEKAGTLLTLDNGRKFQVGTARFWLIK